MRAITSIFILNSSALLGCESTQLASRVVHDHDDSALIATESNTSVTNEALSTISHANEQIVSLASTSNQYGMTDEMLAIWNDPEFQRQFTQSYIAETEIEPRLTKDEHKKMLEILEYISDDEMDKAVALINKHRGDAASAVFDFTLANIYFQDDKLDEAAETYGVAVGKWHKFRRAWRNKAIIHVRKGQWQEAIEGLTKVIELGGNDAITYGLLGYSYANVENSLSAESAYRMAILLDPKTTDWKMGLARSLFRQQRYADVAALCAMLLQSKPENVDLWLLQANAFVGLKQPMQAAENFEIVDRLGGSTPATLNTLGDIYINEELFDVAVQSYIRAMLVDLEGDPARAIRAARVLSIRGAHDETKLIIDQIEQSYDDTLTEDDRMQLLKLKVPIAVAEGAGEEEVRLLEEIVKINPLDGKALILLGQYYGRNDEVEKAIFYFERAAGIEEFEADAGTEHARLLVRQGKYKEALPLLRRVQLIRPRESVQRYLDQIEQLAKTR